MREAWAAVCRILSQARPVWLWQSVAVPPAEDCRLCGPRVPVHGTEQRRRVPDCMPEGAKEGGLSREGNAGPERWQTKAAERLLPCGAGHFLSVAVNL